MKKCFVVFLIFSSLVGFTQTKKLTGFVNPLVGTASTYELSTGNTYPAIALPWGMNFWTPQTGKIGDKESWCYQYQANKICGFKETHQPSPWIKDYGAFSIFPTTEKLIFDKDKRQSWFSHKAEISKPHYYRTFLADYNTTVEITPTERAAFFRITYPETPKAYLVIDAFDQGSYIKVLPKEHKIIGYARNNHGGVPDNFKNYFVIQVDKDILDATFFKDNMQKDSVMELEAQHVGVVLHFKTSNLENVNIRIASSFISPEQAELNLQREIGSQSFDQVKQNAEEVWNKQLSRFDVSGGTDEQLSIFYTALYRTMCFPRKFYEYDANNQIVHYSPYNGKIEKGYMFTDVGFWDVFRAVFPLYTLLFPEMDSQIMAGLVNTYKESGWLPEWASPGHRDCMIGSNSASIIADSYLKGIRGYDIETLYQAILKNTENEGLLSSMGRKGVSYYNQLGYVPYDVQIKGNAARTLEYSYDDFVIGKLAEKLNKPQSEIDKFFKRAHNYQNVFDQSVGFMRGKNQDGTFQSPFTPDKWSAAFTEGCSWHWTWSVFHDPQGLINLMGGKEKFVQKLDFVFSTPATFDGSRSKSVIHEITEMIVMDMGQYAHGNQPIQHMPYLYNYAGEPWKTQFHVREIMKKMYRNAPDGLCGDEDNGQTSAWYVFSALGFYPVAPGTGEYVLGSPLFKSVKLKLENGNEIQLNAPNNNVENLYVQSVTFNGQDYSKNYFRHEDLVKGAKIDFEMSNTINYKRGVNEADYPYSLTKKNKNLKDNGKQKVQCFK